MSTLKKLHQRDWTQKHKKFTDTLKLIKNKIDKNLQHSKTKPNFYKMATSRKSIGPRLMCSEIIQKKSQLFENL